MTDSSLRAIFFAIVPIVILDVDRETKIVCRSSDRTGVIAWDWRRFDGERITHQMTGLTERGALLWERIAFDECDDR